jgi:light-regulated signal transduction histidine kinase (bacteriophytochrome)
MEAEVFLRAQEIQEINHQLQDSNQELQKLNTALESFSYSVSHDLRAPLRSVTGYSQMLLEEFGANLPGEGQRFLQTVITSAGQMDQLIEDLLRLSRLDRQPLNPQPVPMSDLVQKVLKDLQPETSPRPVEIVIGNLPESRGDASLLRQVWINLLSNAFKFTGQREHAKIEVGCEQSGEEKIYFVRDNGAGFDLSYATKLFGAFQRFHHRDQFEGTGVGLSIVHRIIQRHGGRIWAEAAVDQGATFYFTLP